MEIDAGYSITPLSGKKGADGASGTGITVQYSVNGSSSWHATFTNGDVYMRQSTDNGTTWSNPIKVVGEDGEQGEKGDKGDKGNNGGYMKNLFVADVFGQTEETLRARTDWQDAPPALQDGQCLYMATKWIEGE